MNIYRIGDRRPVSALVSYETNGCPAPRPRLSSAVHDNPRPGYGFIEDLREFISLRLDKVDPYRESEEYCVRQEKAALLHDKLLEMLPEEGRAMLLQYSEALGAAHYLEVAMLAERAFLDGVRLILRALGTGSNGSCRLEDMQGFCSTT